jgi:hypothetical protein
MARQRPEIAIAGKAPHKASPAPYDCIARCGRLSFRLSANSPFNQHVRTGGIAAMKTLLTASAIVLAALVTAAAQPAPPTAPAGTSNAVFPSAIDSKYSKESPGRARMHTCRDQYQANKKTGGNGGLKWLQRGGGYYSQCNKRLKGAA